MGIAFSFHIDPQPGPPPIVVKSRGRTISYAGPLGMELIEPTAAAWQEFGRAVDRAGAWTWERAYETPGVLDGIMWELRLRDGERKMRAEGFNAEPPGYDALLRGLQRPIGNRPLW